MGEMSDAQKAEARRIRAENYNAKVKVAKFHCGSCARRFTEGKDPKPITEEHLLVCEKDGKLLVRCVPHLQEEGLEPRPFQWHERMGLPDAA